MKSFLFLLTLAVSAVAGRAEAPPATMSMDVWKAGSFPFYFKYGGKESPEILGNWQRTEETVPAADGQLHRYTFIDPATKLKVVAEARTFNDFDAVDWVLRFTNGGTADTPIIEDIQPLHWTMARDKEGATLHSTWGSNARIGDFAPVATRLEIGRTASIGTYTGRSSDEAGAPEPNAGCFPFFNLDAGGHGVIGAIGWTGNWVANFTTNAAGDAVTMDAGLRKTHLLLHPGETIRTPRILLMNWKGNIDAAQNEWRQLMLADYSPKDLSGKTVTMPICWDTWGTEHASNKLAVIQGMREQKIPADLYWIDAGWYEPITLAAEKNYDVNSSWAQYRGDWVVSKDLYPDGMRPLGESLKAGGIGFLLWFEAETADGACKNLKAHPDWYLRAGGGNAYLNLGNPEALKWITGLVSQFIDDAELTWYRQDFNFSPAEYWREADTPDRVGITETKCITGLYDYWDALRARHPGLKIDNCASGGRRLDIETMSRSVALWRSDNAGDPVGEQFHTVALLPWIPLTNGVWWTTKDHMKPGISVGQLYAERSAYCAGMTVCIDQDPAPWIKQAFEEFDEVRPYFLGDFYQVLPPSQDGTVWAGWQLQKRDRSSGVVVCLRRPASPYPEITLDLKGLDPAASYDVEVRHGIEKAPVKSMTGAELAHCQIGIPDEPGSALIFYTKQ